MSQEVRAFAVTIPAGTSIGSGFTASLAFPTRVVDRIDIRFPPGPRGTVGIQIGASGNQVIPHDIGSYLVMDDESVSWQLTNQIDSGGWELFGYNTGSFDHTIYIRFALSPIPVVQPSVARQFITLPTQILTGGGA